MDEMWTEAARAGAVLRGNRLEWTHALRSVAPADRLARLRQPLLTSKLVPDGTITEAEHPWRGGPKQSQYEKTLVGQNDDKAQIDYDQYAITGDNSYRLRESAGYRQKLLDTKLKDPQTPDLKAKREAVLAEIRAIEAYVQPGKDGMPKKDSLEKAHASVRPMGSAAFPPWILVPSQLRSPIYRWKMKTVGGRLVPGDLPEAEVNGPATYHDLEPPTMTRPTTWNGGSTDYPRTRALWRVTCLLWDLGVRMTALQSTRPEDYKDAFGDEHAEYRGYFTSWPGAEPPSESGGRVTTYDGRRAADSGPNMVLGDGSSHVPPLFQTIMGVPQSGMDFKAERDLFKKTVQPGAGSGGSTGPDGRPVTMVAEPNKKSDATAGYKDKYVTKQPTAKAGWTTTTSMPDCSTSEALNQSAPSWLIRVEDECARLLQLLGMADRVACMKAFFGPQAEEIVASMDLDDLKAHARKRVRNLKLLWDGLGGDEAAEQVWNDRKAWRQSVVQNAASPAEYQHHVDEYWHGFDSDDQWKVSAFRWLAAPGWADNIAGWMHDKKNDGLARLVRLHSERVRALLVHWLRKGTTQAVSASVPEAWWVGAGGPMQNEVLSLMDSERRFAVSVSGLGPQDRPLPPFDRCGFQNPNQAKKNTRQNVPKGNQRLAFTKAVALEWAGIKNVITKMANRTNIDAKALKDNEDASGTKALVPGRPNTLANSQLGDGQPRWRSAFDREEEFYLTRLLGYSEEEASALERFATYGKGSSTIAGKTLARQLLRKWFSSYDPERPRRWHATLNKKKGARSGQTVYDDGTETGQTGPPPRWNADKSKAMFSPEDSDRWAKYNRYGRPWPTLALNPSTEKVKAFKSELERMRTFGSDLQSARLAWALAMVQKLDAEAKADGQQNFDLETFFEQMPPFEYKGTQLWVSGYDIEEEEWKKMEAAAQNVVDKEAAKTAAETANEAAQNALNAEHESQDAAQAAQDAADDAAADLEAAAAELTFAKAQLDLASQGAFPRLAFVFPKASVDLNLKNGTNAAELMKLKARRTSLAAFVYFKQREAEMQHVYALHNFPIAHDDCEAHWRPWSTSPLKRCALTFGADVPADAAALVRKPVVLRTREKTVSDYDHLHMYDFGFENCTTANRMFKGLFSVADTLKDKGLITADQDAAIRAGLPGDVGAQKVAIVYQAVINVLWKRPITKMRLTKPPPTAMFNEGTADDDFKQTSPVNVPPSGCENVAWVDYVKAWRDRRVIPRAWTRRPVRAPGKPAGVYAWTPANRQHPAIYADSNQWTRKHPNHKHSDNRAVPKMGSKMEEDTDYLRSVYGPFMESLSGDTQKLLQDPKKGQMVTTDFSLGGSAEINPLMRLSNTTGASYAARGERWAAMEIEKLVDANCQVYAGDKERFATCTLYDLGYWLYEHEPTIAPENPYAANIKQWMVNHAQFAVFASTIWQRYPGNVKLGNPTVDVHGITTYGDSAAGGVTQTVKNGLHTQVYDPTAPSPDPAKKYLTDRVELLHPCKGSGAQICNKVVKNHLMWKNFYAAPRLGREIQVIRGETIDMVSSYQQSNHVAMGAPFIPDEVRAGERFLTQSSLSVSRNAPYVFTGSNNLLSGSGHTMNNVMNAFYRKELIDNGVGCCLHLITLAKGMPILPLYLSGASSGGAQIATEMEIVLPPNCEWEFLGATDVPRSHSDDVFRQGVSDAQKAQFKSQTVTAHCWFVRWRGVPRGGFPSKQPGGLGNKNQSTFASSSIHLGGDVDPTKAADEKLRETDAQKMDASGGAQAYSDDEHLDWKAGAEAPATQRSTLVKSLADLPNPTFDRPDGPYNEWWALNKLYPTRKFSGAPPPQTEDHSLLGKRSDGKH